MTREQTSTVYACRCASLSGGSERCAWEGDASDLVVVERMPDYLRSSHQAAGNAGSYPANGAERAAVQWECANRLVEGDEEWCRVVEVRDATRYAEARPSAAVRQEPLP